MIGAGVGSARLGEGVARATPELAGLLRGLQIKTFEEATIAALETAVGDWFDERAEERLIEIHFDIDGSNYTCVIVFTE